VGINIYAGSDARNTPRRVHTQGGEEQSKPFQLGFNGFLNVAFQGSRLTSEAGLIPVRRSTPGAETGGSRTVQGSGEENRSANCLYRGSLQYTPTDWEPITEIPG
jgi:hypothetical protein